MRVRSGLSCWMNMSVSGRIFSPSGAVAQLGERLVCNQKVGGSSPLGSIERKSRRTRRLAYLPASGSAAWRPKEKR